MSFLYWVEDIRESFVAVCNICEVIFTGKRQVHVLRFMIMWWMWRI